MKSPRRIITSTPEELGATEELRNIKWEAGLLVRHKIDLLKYSQRGTAFDSPEFRSYRIAIDEFESRLYSIEEIEKSATGIPAFVTMKPIRDYWTGYLIEYVEVAIKQANREFFGSNSSDRITGVVMIENRSKFGNKNYAHAHCMLSSPDGFDCKADLDRLRLCLDKILRKGKKRPATDSDMASLREKVTDIETGEKFAFHYKVHDKYGRCVFPSLNVKSVYDLAWSADYMTKNIMHPEVVKSDVQHGAGLYRIEYPVGVKGDKGNRPKLIRI